MSIGAFAGNVRVHVAGPGAEPSTVDLTVDEARASIDNLRTPGTSWWVCRGLTVTTSEDAAQCREALTLAVDELTD
ncbi:hypothetical protein [Mycobacterium antarcticum]|uniref:hypothetical protein n=1 Tax=Mycolicibacterium sp. TUM20984 TaxID=3023368 RepID=UPI0024E13F95|nr:hypothetical protein [Mycolicibacterium sp. TUM20984]